MALEYPEQLSTCGALNGRCIASLAPLNDPDRIPRPPVGLIETRGLRVAEGNPVADIGSVGGQIGAGDALRPAIGQERGARGSARCHDMPGGRKERAARQQ